ncbi:stage V sporulation protein AA, partial [Bacillus wiedmannii]
MEQTIYIKMRNRLKVSPTYDVKLRDVAQVAGDTVVVESLQ